MNYKRYIKDDANVSKIAKFICDAVKDLMKDDDNICYHYNLDGKFEIAIGWSEGYGNEKRDDVIQSKSKPDYAINAGLKKYNPSEYEYDYMDAPIIDGEPFSSDISIDETDLKNGCRNIATYLVKEYKEVLKELKKSKRDSYDRIDSIKSKIALLKKNKERLQSQIDEIDDEIFELKTELEEKEGYASLKEREINY